MNESWTWILWTVLGVVLVIAEVFTPGFVLLWFGIGALAAALAAFLGAGLAAQFILFIVVSSALTALSRTIFVNYFAGRDEADGLKSGAARLPGQVGTVVSFEPGRAATRARSRSSARSGRPTRPRASRRSKRATASSSRACAVPPSMSAARAQSPNGARACWTEGDERQSR